MKTICVLFLFVLCVPMVMSNDIIKNEYWSCSTGSPIACYFSNYSFYEDGNFKHEYGYSGGGYYVNTIYGNYYYNKITKSIKLEITSSNHDFSYPMFDNNYKTPSDISIIEFTDTTVKLIEGNAENAIFMKRKIGITSDQYWFKGWHSGGDCFSFRESGQTEIKLNEIEYTGEYSIVDGILYLDIRSRRLPGKIISGKQYTREPAYSEPFIKKIFLQIEIEDDIVRIESIDIEKIENGMRDWEYKDGQYFIKNEALSKEIIWENYNRRRSNRK